MQTQSGMVSVEKLEKGELELALLGSPPTTIALSPPRSLPLQVMRLNAARIWRRGSANMRACELAHVRVRACALMRSCAAAAHRR